MIHRDDLDKTNRMSPPTDAEEPPADAVPATGEATDEDDDARWARAWARVSHGADDLRDLVDREHSRDSAA